MKQSREIKSFIFGQYFSDGIRITIGVLLPSLVFFQLGLLEVGLTISLGALCVSIPDNQGPVIHRRNGMLFCILFTSLTALITGAINSFPVLLGVELVILCFFFSMFSVYGARASAVGTAALLVLILTIDEQITSRNGVWLHALYIFLGGLWYAILSISLTQFRPYRLAQQALGESIREVAEFVQLKGNFYDVKTDFDENYKKLVDQQIIVHQHQDGVRELLFKSRLMVKESTTTGRSLILVFVDILDLFEQTMATHYDYQSIRNIYWKTGVLESFKKIILKLRDELENLSYHIISNEKPSPLYDFNPDLEKLKKDIDEIAEEGINNLVLKKILINIRNMIGKVQKIYTYFNPKQLSGSSISRPEDFTRFVSHQDFDIKQIRENLTFNSSTFRHSIRVALMLLIGFLVSKLFPLGHHSYWILLTILVILKPAYSLTKKRNIERLIGTIIGGLAGAGILFFVDDQTMLFVLLLVFMVAAYSFQRLNYVVSVLFMTPYTLILLSFLGESDVNIAQERIIDTFVGSIIALSASFIILPNWEYTQVRGFMKEVLIANYRYLAIVGELLSGKNLDVTAYKLVRKDVYVNSANLASAFQRMLSEPKSKQQSTKEIHKFVVLNHILSSYIATLITTLRDSPASAVTERDFKLIRKALYRLAESIRKTGDHEFSESEFQLPKGLNEDGSGEDDFLYEQLGLINKLTKDIQKLSQN